MDEIPSEKPPRSPLVIFARLILYAALAIGLILGTCFVIFYLMINYQYMRADFVASRAQGRVEKIYEQVRESVPNGATLISESKPRKGIYHFALSDGAPQYASVDAQQIYTTNIPFSEVVAAYKDQFKKRKWDALSAKDETDLLSLAFRHPHDENLIVGLCLPQEPFPPTYSTIQYTVFFDFDETNGCEGSRLGCVAGRYCK
jgi:hypothetical protein